MQATFHLAKVFGYELIINFKLIFVWSHKVMAHYDLVIPGRLIAEAEPEFEL